MTRPLSATERGFTLFELLVAIAVFAVLSAMVYSALTVALTAREQTELHNQRRTAIMHAMTLIERDLLQMVQRPVRDEFDQLAPPFLIARPPQIRIELTRTGVPNPRRENRSALQRVGYGLEDGKLIRRTWSVLDRTAQTRPLEETLLEGVESFRFEAVGGSGVSESWPPEEGNGQSDGLPRVVRILIKLEEMEELVREVPTVGTAGESN